MRVVFDSNVWLAGFTTRGLCENLIQTCLSTHELFICAAILDEIRKHLPAKFRVPAVRVAEIISLLESQCTIVEPLAVDASACRDRDDLMVLGTALAAAAEYVVTGDKDLLTLKSFDTIPILSPREFYEKLK